MSMPMERPIQNPDPSAAATPAKPDEPVETQWFDSGVFSTRRTSFPPPPSSKVTCSPPLGDNLADDWFR